MNNIRILFARSRTLGGFLIRTALFSEYNHVGIMINNKVYDSTFSKGVARNTIAKFYDSWDVDYHIDIQLTDNQYQEVLNFLESQLGKKYDWRAIISLPFRRDWHKEDAWICSELVAEAMVRAGMELPMYTNRVTPRDLLFLLPLGIKSMQKKSLTKRV